MQGLTSTDSIILSIYDDTRRIGYIHYIEHNYQTIREVSIFRLYIDDEYQRQGYGTFLMALMFTELSFKHTQKNIIFELDDMTDLARTPNSIYVKFGFEYKEDSGPEMKMEMTKQNFRQYLYGVCSMFYVKKMTHPEHFENITIKSDDTSDDIIHLLNRFVRNPLQNPYH
jgi:GNAT superfamily N-acetyltransferase